MNVERAETIALKAVAWLMGNEDLRGVFLGATGTSEMDLRSRLNEDAFLVSILDFLMNDDAWVTAFCDEHGFDYMDPMMARQSLPGGAEVNWT